MAQESWRQQFLGSNLDIEADHSDPDEGGEGELSNAAVHSTKYKLTCLGYLATVPLLYPEQSSSIRSSPQPSSHLGR